MTYRCPKCKLSNPPSAQRCDCGYDFNSKKIEESYLTGLTSKISEPLAYEFSSGKFYLLILKNLFYLILLTLGLGLVKHLLDNFLEISGAIPALITALIISAPFIIGAVRIGKTPAGKIATILLLSALAISFFLAIN